MLYKQWSFGLSFVGQPLSQHWAWWMHVPQCCVLLFGGIYTKVTLQMHVFYAVHLFHAAAGAQVKSWKATYIIPGACIALLSGHALLHALCLLRLAAKEVVFCSAVCKEKRQLVMGHLVEQESLDLPVFFQGNTTEESVENQLGPCCVKAPLWLYHLVFAWRYCWC